MILHHIAVYVRETLEDFHGSSFLSGCAIITQPERGKCESVRLDRQIHHEVDNAFSPTPARRAEAMKMIIEKQMAVIEGMNVAALSAVGTWMKLAGGQSVSVEAAGREIAKAAMRPGRRRVKADARALKRRKHV